METQQSTSKQSFFLEIKEQLVACGKQLFLTAFIYKLLASIILFPLFGVLFRWLITFSGDEVLSDASIALFFVSPVGLLCLIISGGVLLGILAFEQTALLHLLNCSRQKQESHFVDSIRYSLSKVTEVLRLTIRMVMWSLVLIAPYLLVAGGVYLWLLSEFDINYYLNEKPPEFLVSLGIAALLVVGIVTTLVSFYSAWLFALPLVLFEEVPPREALKESQNRTRPSRLLIIKRVFLWGLGLFLLSSLLNFIVVLIGRMLVPQDSSSLTYVATMIGIMLLLWGAIGLFTNLLGTSSFAALIFTEYLEMNPGLKLTQAQIQIPETSSSSWLSGLTKPRLIAAMAVGVVASIGIGYLTIGSMILEDEVEITAHRGSSVAAPENTMAAFHQAIEDQADWIELDVQEIKDGTVVVFHDSDFMKLSGSQLKIWDATKEDLQQLDIGSWFGPEHSDQRVPTLDEVLKACKNRIKVNIELKYYGHDQQLEQSVAEVVEANQMEDQIVLMSLKMNAVKKMKALRPDWKVGLLMSVAAGRLAAIDADFFAINASFADQTFIEHAHDLNKEVHVWTVNDAATMSTMMSRGVDNIITDKPDLARTVLEQRADMTLPQRMLLELGWVFGIEPDITKL